MVDRPSDDDSSDADLLAAFVSGDVAAFERLYHRHRSWVLRTARTYTHDDELALDVLQEVFAYLVERAPGLELRVPLGTFLYPAVRHLALRARDRARRAGGDVPPERLEETLDAGSPGVEDPGEAELRLRDLRHLVDRLAPGPREVLLRVAVDGSTLAEVAADLDIPLGTVKSRLHQALQALRRDAVTRRYFERDPER